MSNPSEILRESRAAFEKWAVEGGLNVETFTVPFYPPGTYADSRTDAAWKGWEARRALEGRPSLEPSADSLHKLLELCDISDESHYSTLSVSTVRGLVQDALSHPTERLAQAVQRPAGERLVQLDRGPRFPECEDSEPSLRMLVHKYYERHFPLKEANILAMRYLDALAETGKGST